MSSKNTATVVIGGKVIRLTGYESEEYLQRVASYLNHKNSELEEIKGWKRMTSDMKSQLLALNIADDYFKAKIFRTRIVKSTISNSRSWNSP